MSRQRVLILHDSLSGWGTEKNLLRIGECADRQVFDVSYLMTAERKAPQAGGVTQIARLGAPRLRVNRYSQPLNFLLKFLWGIAWLYRARRSYDYLIVSNPEESVIADVAIRLCGMKSKLLVYNQIPLDLGPANWFLRLALRAFIAINKRSDGVICLSRGLCEHMASTHGVRTRMYVLPSCIDRREIERLAKEKVEEAWLARDSRKTIAFVGRLSNRQKRVDVLLEATALLAKRRDRGSFKLILVGDGEDRPELEQLAKRLGLGDCAYFLGYQSNPYKYYALSDLFVLSSDVEGFGNVIIEAMACGVPVVSTNCLTGPSEILENGKWGELVEPGNASMLADRMSAILWNDELRRDMKQRSLTRAGSFECAAVLGEFTRICEEVVRERGP